MTFGLNATIRSARLALIGVAMDAAATPGVVRLYSGSRPPVAGGALAGAVLQCTVPLADPGTTLSGTVLTFVPGADGVRVAADPITWARFEDGDGTFVMDGSVSTPGNGGDVFVSATTGVIGGLLRLTTGTLSE